MTELATRRPSGAEATHHDPEQDLELTVTGIESVADGVVALTLRHPGGGDLPRWTPGAHVDLHLGPEMVRQYSLCGDPADRGCWRFAVLREADSRGGSERVHALAVGDSLLVRGPRNHFPLDHSPKYIFVAGGIGITPILPMVAAAEAARASWELLYGGRTRESMAFVDALGRHGDRVALRPQDEHGLLDLRSLLAEPRHDTLIYCCGPEPLLVAVEEASSSWPRSSLRVERFSPRPVDPSEIADDGTIEVECRASGVTLTVAADTSILAAAERAGLPVASSCQEGICGTCETAVLDGRPTHRDSVLSDEERASGEIMMICCSRGTGLVLDL